MATNYPLTIQNEQGTLRVHTSVFVALADEIIETYGNRIRLENHRSDFATWVVKSVGASKMDACMIRETENGLSITLSVVMAMELNSEEIAHAIIERYRSAIKRILGINPYSIRIHVTGLQNEKEVQATNYVYQG